MNPIFYLLLIAIGGGILAITLAIALVIFIVGFVGWLVTVVRLFSKWRKDSIVQRSAAAEWMQEPPFVRPERTQMSRQKLSLPKEKEVLQNVTKCELENLKCSHSVVRSLDGQPRMAKFCIVC